MAEATVAVRDLRKEYGEVEAVRGISFEIAAGECFGLLGPNGAGKTTTIEVLEGLLPPSAGEVVVLGRRWGRDDREIRERLGVCLQQTVLSEKLQVGETMQLFRSLYREGREPEAVLAEVGLSEKRKARVGTLSGGQKQRLAVACALVGDPEVLFLDEPTTGLDPQSRRQVWEIVNGFKTRGRTVLLTTHYMDEAERLCDRVAVVDHGLIIAEGSPRELVTSLGGDHVVEISAAPSARGPLRPPDLEGLPAVRAVHAEAGQLLLTVTEPHRAIPALLDRLQEGGWELASLTTRHASLEDVFVALTGRHLRDA
ncbi:MAG TPA: ABC transporter ATP-binding protein [Vicinamibacteria bacterium]|jgi:ABC-2 type transport system ATP-binding protein|nr:ABC transporter ATP-binding protein [Vicinamibacteria bacterium]